MLELAGSRPGYGASQVLFGVSLAVGAGEVRDPARAQRHGQDHDRAAIMGLFPPGRRDPLRRPAHGPLAGVPDRPGRARLVPEGRQIFPNLTVRENLVATAANRGA